MSDPAAAAWPAQPAPADATQDDPARPLRGLRVLEFSHMVMGPVCGLVLADLGADVVKVEPPGGELTRTLMGSGTGFFPMFNRNKRSIELDLRQPAGAELARRLAARADVVVENFKPGALRRYGLDGDSLCAAWPRLIHVSHKGFLPGPYEHRTALDEVVQMMGGLAYMTGRPGDPLRAGSSVNDIMGGLFGALGVLAALLRRAVCGRGQQVQAALFENNTFLMGQHMLQAAMTGRPPQPMPARDSPWALYDVFTVQHGEQIFLAAVSDAQWVAFCDALEWPDLRDDPALARNNQRVQARPRLLATLRERLAPWPAAELAARMERAGLPFAPIGKPQDLLDDPHLQATGGLAPVVLPDGARAGQTVAAPLLPIALDGRRPPLQRQPPRHGEHTREVLRELGCSEAQIAAWLRDRVIGAGDADRG